MLRTDSPVVARTWFGNAASPSLPETSGALPGQPEHGAVPVCIGPAISGRAAKKTDRQTPSGSSRRLCQFGVRPPRPCQTASEWRGSDNRAAAVTSGTPGRRERTSCVPPSASGARGAEDPKGGLWPLPASAPTSSDVRPTTRRFRRPTSMISTSPQPVRLQLDCPFHSLVPLLTPDLRNRSRFEPARPAFFHSRSRQRDQCVANESAPPGTTPIYVHGSDCSEVEVRLPLTRHPRKRSRTNHISGRRRAMAGIASTFAQAGACHHPMSTIDMSGFLTRCYETLPAGRLSGRDIGHASASA
jgi:hypothetical protein